MASATLVFLCLLVLSCAFAATGWFLAYRLAPARDSRTTRAWLWPWSVKGLLVPLGLWALMNVGLSWRLQPFMPEVQMAQYRGGNWFPEFLIAQADGLFIVSSFWCAVTLAWALGRVGVSLEGDARSSFNSLCWTCLLGMMVPALIILWIGGWYAFGLAATFIFAPAAGYTPTLLHPKQVPPMYARAIARLKFGKYTEAEWEIIRQLEKCEDDFEGWMMMADLYANHFNNVAQAEQTILEICDQPKTTPTQLAIALHRLADWHLKITGDPQAARRALQMICDRLPGGHLAHMATLRLNQLPSTAEELRQQQSRKPIPLPAARIAPKPALTPAAPALDQEQVVDLAHAYADQLKREPNNVSAREKLARLLAERLNQADEAIGQLSLLLNLPDQPDTKRAEWMSLIASWHLKHRQDSEAGRHMLERLVREFPQSTQAQTARRRLDNLGSEGL